MVRRIIFIFLCTIASGFAENFLWKIADKGGNFAYLHGSLHLVKKDFYPVDKNFLSAFNSSDALAVEMDYSSVTSEQNASIVKLGSYSLPDTLSNYIDPKLFEKLVLKFQKYGFKRDFINSVKPWMLLMLHSAKVASQLGLVEGSDVYLCKLAKSNNKPIVELEGINFQLEIFEGIAKKYPNEFVSYLISEDCIDNAESFNSIYNFWVNAEAQSLGKLFEVAENSSASSQKIMEFLNHGRNKLMVKKLERCIASGKRFFVVVGAAHLVGERGLLKTFEKNGYKIEQVKKK